MLRFHFLANVDLFKVNNRNNRKRGEICSKLTIKAQNDVADVVLVSVLLTLNKFQTFIFSYISCVSMVDFEHACLLGSRFCEIFYIKYLQL